ncbi:VWA domain-containing protein [Candidatus Dependentiae bacterium]|nr:MAG: VWA domain-containing protein [Candidatus Dependentiae bacterium]
MEFMFRFAYPFVLYLFLPSLIILAFIRLRWARQARYRYSLASEFKQSGLASNHPYKKILFVLRMLSLLGIAFLIARPQLVDLQSKVKVEGINIILTLDISGSMHLQDDENDNRSRINVAKEEAIRFINKRDNDAIGLVLFANDAISRCPLTLDKKILNSIIEEVDIGTINPDGTLLARGLITAINRLRKTKANARSNIIILLTDGTPSEGDLDPTVAIEVAKQLGIKIYTVGIGSDTDKVFMHPFYGIVAYPKVNKELLSNIAKETGGKFFLANNPQDMRAIYDTIDQLEKIEQEMPLFSHYYDIFMPFLWFVFILLVLELFLSSLIWFGI